MTKMWHGTNPERMLIHIVRAETRKLSITTFDLGSIVHVR